MFKRKVIAVMCALGLLALASVATSTTAHASSPFVLWNTWTSKCADLPGYGTPVSGNPVTQYACDDTSSDNQLWYAQPITYDSGVGAELYEFVNAKSGLCLDPPGYGADAPATNLHIFQCNPVPANDNQEWYVLQAYDATSGLRVGTALVNYKSGLCLDVSGWASNGTDLASDIPLTLYYCDNPSWDNHGWDDHLWFLPDGL